MFGYCHLPFSTSYTPTFNGEIFNFILDIGHTNNLDLPIRRSVSFVLNIEKDRVVVL